MIRTHPASLLAVVALAVVALAACGDGDDGAAAGGDECEGVDTTALEDIWGDVEANAVGGTCSILVADGELVALDRAEAAGEAGYEELVQAVTGARDEDELDIGDRAVRYTGTAAGDVYVVLSGDTAFRIAAVDLPHGQMEATARILAASL